MSKHGHASNWDGKKVSPTYRTWTAMVQRCCNPKHIHYSTYKNMLCEEWKTFEKFLKDMGERPQGMSIDRIDNTKGYYKENCRWATAKQQCRNRRASLPEHVVEEIKHARISGMRLKDIAFTFNINISRAKNIIYRGDYK